MDYTILTSGFYIFPLDVPGEFIYYILPDRLPGLAEEAFLHPFQLLEKLGIVAYPFETYSINDDHIETIRCAFRANRVAYRQRAPFHAEPSDYLLHVMSFTGARDRLVFVAQAFAEFTTSSPVHPHLIPLGPYLLYCFRIPHGEPIDLDPYIADAVGNYVQSHTDNPWDNWHRFNTSLFDAVRRFVAHQRATRYPSGDNSA